MKTTHTGKAPVMFDATNDPSTIEARSPVGETITLKLAQDHTIKVIRPIKGEPGFNDRKVYANQRRIIRKNPEEIAANAHRIYEWLGEIQACVDTVSREWVFQVASAACQIPYGKLYDAWDNEEPLAL